MGSLTNLTHLSLDGNQLTGEIPAELGVLGTAAAQQMEPPALPHQFYGTVTINGASAPDGTWVSAEVDGVEAKTGTTREGKYGL